MSGSDAGRESALSVRRGWWVAYALLFSIQVIAWTILVVLVEIRNGDVHRDPSEIAIAVGLKVGTLIVVSIAYTMILLEGVRSLMVIADYLRDKLNEKRKADAAKRKAEEEKRINEAVNKAVAEAMEAIETAREDRNKAIVEIHQAWTAWNQRRIEADERNEPFDEDPPEFPHNIRQVN